MNFNYLTKPYPKRKTTVETAYNCKAIELNPHGSRKSFYNKAYLLDCGRFKKLLSYDTVVLVYDSHTQEFYRTWFHYSPTTGRHIHSFSLTLGHNIGKQDYLALPYTDDYTMFHIEQKAKRQ